MKKYPRTYHLPISPGAKNDDKISETSENLIGVPIVINEKLDGSNSSITKDGVYGRSHAETSKNPWDRENWNLYYRIRNDIPDGVYLFGEGMEGIHSIEYSNLESFFYLFGVRDNNIWIAWDQVEEYSYLLDIPTVPVLFKGIVNTEKELYDLVLDLSKGTSKLGGELEGVVVRTEDMFHEDDFGSCIQKMVRADHVQTDIHWTRNWKKAKLVDSKF